VAVGGAVEGAAAAVVGGLAVRGAAARYSVQEGVQLPLNKKALLQAVLRIRIRSDPDLFVGSGS
jgi:hypothetical protein